MKVSKDGEGVWCAPETLFAKRVIRVQTPIMLLFLGLIGKVLASAVVQGGTVFRAGGPQGEWADGNDYVSAVIGEQGILALQPNGQVALLEQKEASTHFLVPLGLTNAVAIAALGNAAGALAPRRSRTASPSASP